MTIPTITTERLTMRAPRASDIDVYADFRASSQMEHLGGTQTREQAWHNLTGLAGQWLLRGYGRWMVTVTGDDTPVGVVGLYHPDAWSEAEIGWSLFPGAEGRGIAYEAALASRRYAYGTLGWTTVISHIAPGNTRSEALARRLGCTPGSSFSHPDYGVLTIWRHPAADTLRPAQATSDQLDNSSAPSLAGGMQ